MVVRVSPVAGSCTWMVRPEVPSTQAPPMYNCVGTFASSSLSEIMSPILSRSARG